MSNNITILQMSPEEFEQKLRQIIREESRDKFAPEQDEIGGIELAVRVTGLAQGTIYSKCSKRKIPHSKHSGKLTFSRKQLNAWMLENPRRTKEEITKEYGN